MGDPRFWSLVLFYMGNIIKGIKPWLRVDILSELCFPFLKGGNSTFIAAIASFFNQKANMSLE